MNHKDAKREAEHNRRTLVFHLSFPVPRNLQDPSAQWPDGYRLVADVDTEDLETAFLLTNHVERAWQENEGVFAYVKCCRSTSPGDVLVTPDGKAHLCLDIGWRELGEVV
jgi:hypothetical protein